MPKAKLEFTGICTNSGPDTVKITRESWRKPRQSISYAAGDKPIEEIKRMAKGLCNQVKLPDGCPHMQSCTGMVRFEVQENNQAIIWQMIGKKHFSRPRLYRS